MIQAMIKMVKKILRPLLPGCVIRARDTRREVRGLTPFQRAARTKYKELNRDTGIEEIIIRPGLQLRVGPNSKQWFEDFCFRSEQMVMEMDSFMRESVGKKHFLDVGAFHGVFSLAFTFGRPDAFAIALDPSPQAYSVLQYHVRINPNCNVTPIQIALGDSNDEIPMKADWQILKAVPRTQGLVKPEGIEMVQAKSGDSLCDEKDFRPDIIKIDVEGYELACLRGLKRTLSLQRPTLCLEIHPLFIEELGETVSGLTAMLAELGYLLFGLDGQKIDNVEVESLRNVTRLVAKPA